MELGRGPTKQCVSTHKKSFLQSGLGTGAGCESGWVPPHTPLIQPVNIYIIHIKDLFNHLPDLTPFSIFYRPCVDGAVLQLPGNIPIVWRA